LIKLTPAHSKWWNKPLVSEGGRKLPAELVILNRSLMPGENGAWLNSRGTKTGAVDLVEISPGEFKTIRNELPEFVQECLKSFYSRPDVAKGIYDLVAWNQSTKVLRFIEVKCPHWDRQSPEQLAFANLAQEQGISVNVAEWEFDEKF